MRVTGVVYAAGLSALVLAGCAAVGERAPGASGVAQTAAARAELLNTFWRVVEIDGKPATLHRGTREPHLVLDREGNRLRGFTGCNTLSGAYSREGERLSFGKVAMTRMACVAAESNAFEAAFVQALEATVSYRIVGEALELRDAAGVTRMRFQALYLT